MPIFVNFVYGEWRDCLSITKGNRPLTDMAMKAEDALNTFLCSKATNALPISKECSLSPWMKKTEEAAAANALHFNEPPMLLKLVAKDVETLRSNDNGDFNVSFIYLFSMYWL